MVEQLRDSEQRVVRPRGGGGAAAPAMPSVTTAVGRSPPASGQLEAQLGEPVAPARCRTAADRRPAGRAGVWKDGSRAAASRSAGQLAGRHPGQGGGARLAELGRAGPRPAGRPPRTPHGPRCRTRRPSAAHPSATASAGPDRRPVRVRARRRCRAGPPTLDSSSSLLGSGSLPTDGRRASIPCTAAVSAEYDVRRHSRSSCRSKVPSAQRLGAGGAVRPAELPAARVTGG